MSRILTSTRMIQLHTDFPEIYTEMTKEEVYTLI